MEYIGRYEIIRLLGEGGMARVWLARDPEIGRQVAIKVLPRHFSQDPQYLARFRQEARVIAALEHPAIVPVYDYGEHEGAPYLVMRYMAGGSLRERLRNGPLPLPEVARIYKRLAPALEKAHDHGVIHRDLKPGNVLFDADGLAYLADFGIARLAAATGTMTIAGTLGYMSPEQVQGERLDWRSDLYALGVMLFELLTGELHYGAGPVPDARVLNPQLPRAVQPVVVRAMAREPEARYQSAGELAAAVGQAAAGGGRRLALPSWAWWAGALGVVALLAWSVRGLTPDGGSSDTSVAAGPLPTLVAMTATAPVQPDAPTAAPSPTFSLPPSSTPAAEALLTSPAPATKPDEEALPASPSTPTATADPYTRPSNPKLGDRWQRTKDAMVMAYVPAGQFFMGSSAADVDAAIASCVAIDNNCRRSWFDDELPRHQVALDAFWIDVTEVTNAQFATFLSERGNQVEGTINWYDAGDPDAGIEADGSGGFRAKPGLADHPATLMTWYAATAYCTWAGGRLPTEAEWEYAARGPAGSTFPWGDSFDGSKVNFCDTNCPGLLPSRGSDDGYAKTAPVGSYPGNASWVGALDMAGNVWERTADWYGESYYTRSPARNPTGAPNGEIKTLRGGSWMSPPHYVRATVRNSLVRRSHLRNDYGLRCVVVAR